MLGDTARGCEPLTVLVFKWHDPAGRHNALYTYDSGYVNRMANMLRRHLSRPYELVCVTDDTAGLDSSIRVIELPSEVAALPGEYRKLYVFHRSLAARIGARVLMLDLDLVIVGPIDELVARAEPFIAWSCHENTKVGRFNTSVVLMDTGAFHDAWDRFEGESSIEEIQRLGYDGWEQDWVSHVVGERGTRWARRGEGIDSFMEVRDGFRPTTRIVSFNGRRSPAMTQLQAQFPWITQHWC